MGIGAGAVLSAEKRVAHYGPNFVCLLNAAGAIECLGSDIFGVVSSVPDVNGFTEINGGDTYACAYNETESFRLLLGRRCPAACHYARIDDDARTICY